MQFKFSLKEQNYSFNMEHYLKNYNSIKKNIEKIFKKIII